MATEVLEHATEPRLTRRPATIEEFWSLPESMLHIEFIDGEIVMAPAPNAVHQAVILNISVVLHAFVQKNELGRIFLSPLDVVLPTGEVVQPDIFLLTAEQAERALDEGRVNAVPSFLVEILSPGSIRHDRIRKRAVYEKNGVREYWIVDPRAKSVAQLVLRRKRYVVTELGEGDVISGAVMAGFEMMVGDLLGLK